MDVAITRQHIDKVAFGWGRCQVPIPRIEANWAQKGIVTDKNGTPISAVIIPASTHDIKAVTVVMDNAVIRKQRPTPSKVSEKTKTTKQHLCPDRAYCSKVVEHEIIKREYVSHMPHKRKRGEQAKDEDKAFQKDIIQEGGGLWRGPTHDGTTGSGNFTGYGKKAESYLGLVQLSSSIIIYRKTILGHAIRWQCSIQRFDYQLKVFHD
jgi:hypothetical protein